MYQVKKITALKLGITVSNVFKKQTKQWYFHYAILKMI